MPILDLNASVGCELRISQGIEVEFRYGLAHCTHNCRQQIGEAIIAGVCQVQIDVSDASDTFCGAGAGDTAKLKSGLGSSRILWKESGTGTKWAIVRVGGDGVWLKLATLDATLDAEGSCDASISSISGGGAQTVYDWLLGPDESLASGTKVVIARIRNKWYVIQASCSA